MKRVYSEKENCCGCGACGQRCPARAIRMEADEEGFLYPVIDSVRCVDCGACVSVCPIPQGAGQKAKEEPAVYAAKHKDRRILKESTSGGAFTALSDLILDQGGVIYGAAYGREFGEEGLVVSHFRAETREERNRFRFSKYVQSDTRDTFSQVKKDLQNGRTVLFTGTPCQNAGLRGYLGGDLWPDHLILCDVICHSVPSPVIWADYVRFLEREYGRNSGDGQESAVLDRAQFRTKEVPWSRTAKSFVFTLKNDPHLYMDDRYHQLLFQFRTVARPSCYACRFASLHRVTDLTIADYWGIEKYLPEFTDAGGVSIILVNTRKGQEYFRRMKKEMEWIRRPVSECLKEQPRLSSPLPAPEGRAREEFWEAWRSGKWSFYEIR